MDSKLKGRRLLILGGTTLMCHVVRVAHSMGVKAIVTDQNPSSPAKALADAAFDVSTGDFDELLRLAIAENINGVFVGYDDFNTLVGERLCGELRLPFYATRPQLVLTRDKVAFKNLCREHGVPVVREFASSDEVSLPVVVKPADSYSAKGITICRSPGEVPKAVERALRFSGSQQYLIESYMDPATTECVNIDYVIRDGDVALSAVGDKFVNDEQGNHAPLTAAVVYPSKYVDDYVQTLDKRVCRMLQSIGIQQGTLYIEAFHGSHGFSVYEMGYRVGGGQSSILLDRIKGVDYVRMLISYALTGSMCDDDAFARIGPEIPGAACGLVVLARPGRIARVHGTEYVRELPEVVAFTQFVGEGDTIAGDSMGTLGQIFARIHLVCDSWFALKGALARIATALSVVDLGGKSLLLQTVTPKMWWHLDDLILQSAA